MSDGRSHALTYGERAPAGLPIPAARTARIRHGRCTHGNVLRRARSCRHGTSSGLPRRELEEAAGRGELVLGGCLVSFDAPDRACVNCGHEWQTGELPAWFRTRFADS